MLLVLAKAHVQKQATHTPSVSDIVLMLICFIFRHTHWPNNTQYWQQNGVIIHCYVQLIKVYFTLVFFCPIKSLKYNKSCMNHMPDHVRDDAASYVVFSCRYSGARQKWTTKPCSMNLWHV